MSKKKIPRLHVNFDFTEKSQSESYLALIYNNSVFLVDNATKKWHIIYKSSRNKIPSSNISTKTYSMDSIELYARLQKNVYENFMQNEIVTLEEILNVHLVTMLEFIYEHYDMVEANDNIAIINNAMNKLSEYLNPDEEDEKRTSTINKAIHLHNYLQQNIDQLQNELTASSFEKLRLEAIKYADISQQDLDYLKDQQSALGSYVKCLGSANIRHGILKTICVDRSTINVVPPDNVAVEVHDIIFNVLNIIPFSERYVYFYSISEIKKQNLPYNISPYKMLKDILSNYQYYKYGNLQAESLYFYTAMYALYYCLQFIKTGNYQFILRAKMYMYSAKLDYMYFKNYIKPDMQKRADSGDKLGDQKFCKWIQHQTLQYLSQNIKNKFDDKTTFKITFEQYILNNNARLLKDITKHIFWNEHYFEVATICKATYGKNSKTNAHYIDIEDFMKHLNIALEVKGKTRINNHKALNTKSDITGVYKSLNHLVKFYLNEIISVPITIESGYNALFIYSIEKDLYQLLIEREEAGEKKRARGHSFDT